MVIAAFLVSMRTGRASAQYIPIPNYTGIGAGQQFRNDLNNHLSGVSTVAPRLVQLTFAQLPQEQDGQLYWCKDCQQTSPCQSGGNGSLVTGAQGQWSCSTGGGSGSAFPLGSDVSAASHRIESLAADQTAGDALSRGQSSLTALTVPTAAFNMNSQKLQGLAVNTATGDALSQNQSKLTDLAALTSAYSVNGQKLQALGAGGVAGDAIAFAQGNAQLKHNQPGIAVASSSSGFSSSVETSQVITAPTSIASGNALVALLSPVGAAAETWGTLPAGWTQIGSNISNSSGNGAVGGIFCKTATASEPGSYTFTWSSAAFFLGGIVQLAGTNCSQVDASGASNNSNAAGVTVTAPALSTTHENDFVIAAGSQYGGGRVGPSLGTTIWNQTSNSNAAVGFVDAYPPTPALTFAGTAAANAMVALDVAFYPTSTITAAPILHGSSGGTVNDLAGSLNGTINVQSATVPIATSAGLTLAMGATGDGNHDDTAAIQNAVDAACGMTSYAGTAMYVHNGMARVLLPYTGATSCYKITQPIRVFCGGLDFGSDPHSNGWGQHAKLCPNFAGPAVVVESPTAQNLSYATSLVTGTGNSYNTATGGSGSTDLVLSDWLNSRLVNFNSDSAFGVELVMNISSLGSTGQLFEWDTAASPGGSNVVGNDPRVVRLACDSSGHTICLIRTTTSGTVQGTSTDTGCTLNVQHTMSIDWNGSNLYCFRDGVEVVGPLTAAGSLYTATASGSGFLNVAEEPELNIGYWPDTHPLNAGGVVGKLDAINIANVALHTAAYTPATVKPTVNANTQLLINFEGNCTTTGQTGCSPDSMQLAHTGVFNDGSGQMNVFLPVRGVNGGASVPNVHLHDLELCPGNNSSGNDGLFAIWAQQSEFDHLSCANANSQAFNFFDNDWEDYVHDDQASGDAHAVGFDFGTAYNESHDATLFDQGGHVMSVSNGNGGTFDEDFRHATDGYEVYDWIYNATKFTLIWPFTDIESGAPYHLANFHIDNTSFGSTIIDGQYNTRNGAPYLDVWGGYPVTVMGSQFDVFGASAAAAEVFNHVDAQGNSHYPKGPDVLINDLVSDLSHSYGGTEIPLSNPAGWVLDLGDFNGGDAKAVYHGTVASGAPAAPTCNAGIDGHTFRVSDANSTCTAGNAYTSGGTGRCEVSCKNSVPGYVYTGAIW